MSETSPTPAVQAPPAFPNDALYYLSASQASVVARKPILHDFTSGGSQLTPGGCYVPHRKVAEALRLSPHGIDMAIKRYGNYIWAPEFENVHSLWKYTEPGFMYRGIRFKGPEQFYHAHKVGAPGSDAYQENCKKFADADADKAYELGQQLTLRQDWELVKDNVMRTALRLKFSQCEELKQLLLVTYPHPLVSVKSDAYWGTGNDGKGKNRLGFLLMELRADLRADL